MSAGKVARLSGLSVVLVGLCALLFANVAAAWSPLGEPVEESGAPGNVVVDPSLEEGQWKANAGAAMDSQSARTGKIGARIERRDDKSDPSVTSPTFEAAPGRWLASGWLRTAIPYSADPGYSAVLDVTWLDDGGTRLGSDRVAAVNGVTHVWVCRQTTVAAPPGTTKGQLAFRFN